MIKNYLPSQSVAEKQFYYPFIDGLRGIAILMVLLGHVSQGVGNTGEGSLKFHLIERFINSCGRGVQLFFIVSAFTLFNSFRARRHAERYPVADFCVRRIFRIMPFWSLIVIYKAFESGVINDVGRIILNISFAFGFVRFRPGLELVGGGWSLFIEETFYWTLPFIFLFIKDIYQAFKFFLLTLFLALVWLGSARGLGVPAANDFISRFPLAHWFAFAIGILCYFLIINENFRNLVIKNPKSHFVFDAIVLIPLFLSFKSNFILPTFLLIFLFIASVPEKSVFGLITRNPVLKKFGVYCYSIYLLQFPLLGFLDPFRKMLFAKMGIAGAVGEVKLMVWFPIVALASFCAAFLTFNLIEKPSINLGKRAIAGLNRALDSLPADGVFAKLKKIPLKKNCF